MGNLILSRKAGESIVIGDDGQVVVTVLSVRGGTVDVRIAAPREVSVHRDEIYAKLHPDSVPEAIATGVEASEKAREPKVFQRRRHHVGHGMRQERPSNHSDHDPLDVNGNR